MGTLHGIVLAAGAGRRMGRAKALVRSPDGTPWLVAACELLRRSGSDRVTVVLGSSSDEALPLVPPGVQVVVADDWASGVAASLRSGLEAAAADDSAGAALITLVDLPGLPASVGQRVVGTPSAVQPWTPATLRQAVFARRPGHPVLIGRDHWAPLAETLVGDSGARTYLLAHGVTEVECADLATGEDDDGPGTP